MTMETVWGASQTFNLPGESGDTLTEGMIDRDILVQRTTTLMGDSSYTVRFAGPHTSFDKLLDAWEHFCNVTNNEPTRADAALAREYLIETSGRGVLHTHGYRRA